MKKIFSFNRVFLAFCIFFILVWIALQIVSYMRLKGMAKVDGDRILTWTWTDKNVKSVVKIYETEILKKEHNDAIVKILADQSIEPIVSHEISASAVQSLSESSGQPKSNSKCAVTLTYYRTNNLWFLGKVDLE